MNDRTFERLLADVVDDGPIAVRDGVIEEALGFIPTTAQRGPVASSLRRITMPFRFVPALAVTALVAVVGLGALFSLGALGTGSGPTPTPTFTCEPQTGPTRTYTTSAFQVPLALDLPISSYESEVDPALIINQCAVPWQITEGAQLLEIRAPAPKSDRLTILPVDVVRLTGHDGSVAWPDDFEAWLKAEPGVTVPAVQSMLSIDGVPTPVVDFDIDSSARPDGAMLIGTADGSQVVFPEGRSHGSLVVLEIAGTRIISIYTQTVADVGAWGDAARSITQSLRPGG